MNLLRRRKKRLRDYFKVPHSAQDCLPMQKVYDDGIFYLGNNRYSKTYKFTDINFASSNERDKESILLTHCDLLNSFDSGSENKITIINRKISTTDLEKLKLNNNNDFLDVFRNEYSGILLDKAEDSSSMIQERYITSVAEKKSINDARMYFRRTGTELSNHLNRLNSQCSELNCNDRLKIFYDFYRNGERGKFFFDLKESIKRGHDFKDSICPDSFEIKSDYIKISDRYARVIFLLEYANFISDKMIRELTELNKNMMLSIDITSVPMDEAVKEAEKRRLGVETNVAQWQRRQNNYQQFSAELPYDLKMQRLLSQEFLDDLMTRDQKMFLGVVTIIHTAETKEELDIDTDTLITIGNKNLCEFRILKYQQLEALNTVLPIGASYIDTTRTLTTESLSAFAPYRVQEINDDTGIYYGQNIISKNMIIADRKKLMNGNSFILGVSGSGKSFTAKQEIVSIMLKEPNADVIIIDPEAEYTELVRALGGEVIDISATSDNHINAMDINSKYDDKDPVTLKSEFILSLCGQIMKLKEIESEKKSLIDRCVANVYHDYIDVRKYQGEPPTLSTFRKELLKQEEPLAKDIALALELFTEGSMNTFSKQTNVNVNNRLICYDILELGKNIHSVGMLVILDNILNRITKNRNEKKNTYIFIDEIYLLFSTEYVSEFLKNLWKRVRKYGALCTGITQNISELLHSDNAQKMLSNSEFIILLNQSASDRIELAKLLKISEQELSYITNVGSGQGLIKIGNNLIPFINEFPRDTKLYKLMTTKLFENSDTFVYSRS